MEELLKRTNELLEQLIAQNKDPNELLTAEQIKEETGIGINTVRKMFQDPEFPAQRYTSPFVVARGAFNQYLNSRHDYLSERG